MTSLCVLLHYDDFIYFLNMDFIITNLYHNFYTMIQTVTMDVYLRLTSQYATRKVLYTIVYILL